MGVAALCCCGHRLICGSEVDAGGGPPCHGRAGSGADEIRVTFCMGIKKNIKVTVKKVIVERFT